MVDHTPGAGAQCPVCAAAALADVLTLPQVPVLCNALHRSQAEAQHTPRGDMRLVYCLACGQLFNAAFDPALLAYTPVYDNSLHCSPRFAAYAQALAEGLVARHALSGKTIVEIGCGQGDFLRLLCELGGNRGIGFDPSYRPAPASQPQAALTFVQDIYTPANGPAADLICCRQVLEHLATPRQFVAELRRSLADRQQTAVFFEVPNALFMLRAGEFWDVIYEHVSYFSPLSLARLFTQAGFQVMALAETYGGQFLTLEATPAPAASAPPAANGEALAALTRQVASFARQAQARLADWRARLERWAESGRRLAVWGAGSKGVVFLNALHEPLAAACVVDINPRKQGGYVPGVGLLIVAPAALVDFRPETVIIMNPIYRDEIGQQLAALGLTPDLITVYAG